MKNKKKNKKKIRESGAFGSKVQEIFNNNLEEFLKKKNSRENNG